MTTKLYLDDIGVCPIGPFVQLHFAFEFAIMKYLCALIATQE